MAKLISKRISASTLIEVLIAMVIIMVVFSIAISLFGNVMRGSVSQKKIQVSNQLKLLKNEISKKGEFENTQLTIDSVDYLISSENSGAEGLSTLEIRAEQGAVKLGEIRCLYKTKKAMADEKN
ncbi:hypothetical protein DHW03_03255 [Pedobacter yonginense]|uniref:Type II secretion system protein n=1 Tax=Pedobacter yonginense TaxID=651869 RepID=A0A317ER42_9SPHI|nr:prepilin-type N-terminal cleavage/methylation domain-containing protein [Pedobacter yonginense]PWS28865.1 hypothetical protein DHW03_03255 [Pedobacter yonginense]